MSLGGSLNDCTPPIPDTRNKSPILFILFFILFLKKNKKSRDNGLLLRKKKFRPRAKWFCRWFVCRSERGGRCSDFGFIIPFLFPCEY